MERKEEEKEDVQLVYQEVEQTKLLKASNVDESKADDTAQMLEAKIRVEDMGGNQLMNPEDNSNEVKSQLTPYEIPNSNQNEEEETNMLKQIDSTESGEVSQKNNSQIIPTQEEP